MHSKAQRITIFNHKGGVGKTTLSVNIGAALAEMGKRVLLVDSDPQCNLTSHLLDEEIVDDLLAKSDSPRGRTVFTAMRPVLSGDGGPTLVKPYEPGIEGLYLLPGDISLSRFENRLSDYWAECYRRYPTAYRGTTALSELVGQFVERWEIDYVFYDTGPNIGPLNRVILLDCDFFIVPAACDLFSVRALKTLGSTLRTWIEDWRTISQLAPDETYLLPGRPRFLGYIPQRFRTYGGAMTQVNSEFFSQFKSRISRDLIAELKAADPGLSVSPVGGAKLGSVKDFSTLVQLSQEQGKPLWRVSGGSEELKDQARKAFNGIARKLHSRVRGK